LYFTPPLLNFGNLDKVGYLEYFAFGSRVNGLYAHLAWALKPQGMSGGYLIFLRADKAAL